MRILRSLAVLVLALVAAPLAAQQHGPAPDSATTAEVLRLREAAWRTWFANDRPGFQRVVPAELVALGWDGGPWQDRAATMAAMADFAKGGARLTTLEFPRNVLQQYGDVVIVYSTFRVVVTDTAGKPSETRGRGTEIFVRRGGRWIHTGWHLDTVAE